jgi:hypothetical protein
VVAGTDCTLVMLRVDGVVLLPLTLTKPAHPFSNTRGANKIVRILNSFRKLRELRLLPPEREPIVGRSFLFISWCGPEATSEGG